MFNTELAGYAARVWYQHALASDSETSIMVNAILRLLSPGKHMYNIWIRILWYDLDPLDATIARRP